MRNKKTTKAAQLPNATEAINSFVGFLTTREEPVILSRHHDAAAVAELVGAFVAANKLPNTRKSWPKWTAPAGTDYITNVPREQTSCRQPTLDEVAHNIVQNLKGGWSPQQRNAIIAKVINSVQGELVNKRKELKEQIRNRAELLEDNAKYQQDLHNILNGNFTVV